MPKLLSQVLPPGASHVGGGAAPAPCTGTESNSGRDRRSMVTTPAAATTRPKNLGMLGMRGCDRNKRRLPPDLLSVHNRLLLTGKLDICAPPALFTDIDPARNH